MTSKEIIQAKTSKIVMMANMIKQLTSSTDEQKNICDEIVKCAAAAHKEAERI